MTTIILCALAYGLGVWSEFAFDVSGRVLAAWREWQARRKP